MSEFDSTFVLLSQDLPDVGVPLTSGLDVADTNTNDPRPSVDSDEEEVFFGPLQPRRERFGKSGGYVNRLRNLRSVKAPASGSNLFLSLVADACAVGRR
jgi:hypothetical protein